MEFEDDPDFGSAMAFDFEGQSYWLEHQGGGFLSLGRLCDENDICMLHPKSNQFKEQTVANVSIERPTWLTTPDFIGHNGI